MRLLNVETMQLEEFIGHDCPPYTILSHTWGQNEVTFQDLTSGNYRQLDGYAKVAGCCKRSRQEGYTYTWIDTCCIDKSSSAELSEAINSMFRWYRNSAICYAYLNDVKSQLWRNDKTELVKSKWFTRGWTLQELIAPNIVVFLTSSWDEIGSKTASNIAYIISSATGINAEALTAQGGDGEDIVKRLRQYSIAQKLSWAAGRMTTRAEDRAYSLLGLFEVNMPLLYGEGEKAFLRLQEAIMHVSNDATIFVWAYGFSLRPRTQGRLSGLVAPSLDCFEGQQDVEILDYTDYQTDLQTPPVTVAYELLKNTLRVRATILCSFLDIADGRRCHNIGLTCTTADRGHMLLTYFIKTMNPQDWTSGLRHSELMLLDCRGAYGRIGFFVDRKEKGVFERNHTLLLVFLPNLSLDIPVAEYHHFSRLPSPLLGITRPQPLYCVKAMSLLAKLGYDEYISDIRRTKRGSSVWGKDWSFWSYLEGCNYVLLGHRDSQNWPIIAIDLYTTVSHGSLPVIPRWQCTLLRSTITIENAIEFRRNAPPPDDLSDEVAQGEFTMALNSTNVLIVRSRQTLWGGVEILLLIESRKTS